MSTPYSVFLLAASLGIVLFVADVAVAADDAASPSQAKEPALVLRHVKVVPMDRDVTLDDQTVVVDSGRIVAIGHADEVAIPEGATVIECAGKWLMPGLADMHVHLWMEDDLTLFVANGVTTVRNMFGSPQQLAWREEIAANQRFGPRLYTAGPIIDGNPPVWPGSTVLVDPAKAEAVVLAQKEAGYDFLKAYSRLPAAAFHALAEAGKKHGMRVMGHVPDAVSLQDAAAAGQESFEHWTGLVACCQDDDSPFTLEGSAIGGVTFMNEAKAWKQIDDAKIAAAAKTCAEAGLWSCPTIVVMQAWAKGDAAEAALARPEMRFVSPQIKDYWTSPAMYLAQMSDAFLATSQAADSDRKRAVKIFHDAGAGLLCGTDMGNPFVVAGFSLHQELANFVASGLSPYAALRAATADAARFMRAEGDWGTVTVGAQADLILLLADPLEDVSNAAKRAGVVVDGRWFAEADLEERLEVIARRFE